MPTSNDPTPTPAPLAELDGANMATLLLRRFRWFEDGLLRKLAAGGWPEISRRHSTLFGHLDPTGTRPSELARRIGVSRQAVHETIAELQQLGLVDLIDDPNHGRAKIVVLTARGRDNVRAAYRAFAELEAELAMRIGRGRVTRLRETLERDWGPVPDGHAG